MVLLLLNVLNDLDLRLGYLIGHGTVYIGRDIIYITFSIRMLGITMSNGNFIIIT